MQHPEYVTIRRTPNEPLVHIRYEDAVDAVEQILDSNNHLAATTILRQISDQWPQSPAPLTRLLSICRDWMRLDEAEDTALELLARFPRDPDVLLPVAHFYHINNDPDLAITYLERILASTPDHLPSLHLLVAIYQANGDEQNTRKYLDRALKVAPGNPNIVFSVARAFKTGTSERYIREVRKLIDSGAHSGRSQALLHYAMAWFSEHGTEAHFEHLHAANKIVRELQPWDRQSTLAVLARNKALFENADITQLQRHGDTGFHPIFVAALPRSGTTLLEQMIGAHPDAYKVGERGAFDIALVNTLSAGNKLPLASSFAEISDYPGAIRAVAEQYKNSRQVAKAGSQRIIDKSIGNWNATGMILLAFPRARIIHLERHPLDIILSCYQQSFDSGHHYTNSLTTLAQMYNIHREQMLFWKRLFPQSIYTLKYEDLVRDQKGQLSDVLRFCGLAWDDRCMDYRKVIGNITTASDRQVREPLYLSSIDKWKGVQQFITEAVSELRDTGDYVLPATVGSQ